VARALSHWLLKLGSRRHGDLPEVNERADSPCHARSNTWSVSCELKGCTGQARMRLMLAARSVVDRGNVRSCVHTSHSRGEQVSIGPLGLKTNIGSC
jgi:hypothetical protein